MDAESLIIETQPARQDIDFLEDQINAYNLAQTGVAFSRALHRNDHLNEIEGLLQSPQGSSGASPVAEAD